MQHFQLNLKIPALNANDIHVWHVSLKIDSNDIAHYRRTLSTDEKERAERFHFAKDCNRFIAARGMLRALLGCYLGKHPSCIQFSYNHHGKPFLKCFADNKSLGFNVSHSDEKALYAFSKGLPIGVDLERIRMDLSFEPIAIRFFSPSEAAMFCSLPEPARMEAFFNCWTRKEAFVKAKGNGLSLELDQFDVSLRPGEPASLLETRYDQDDLMNWSLHDIDAGKGFKAALAVETIHPQISWYNWFF